MRSFGCVGFINLRVTTTLGDSKAKTVMDDILKEKAKTKNKWKFLYGYDLPMIWIPFQIILNHIILIIWVFSKKYNLDDPFSILQKRSIWS